MIVEENASINFEIRNPNNTLINKHGKTNVYFYEFTALQPGEYQFVLTNPRSDDDKRVTFAIHQGNNTNTHLSHENLNNVWNKLLDITSLLKTSSFTSKMLSKKYDAKYEAIKEHNNNIVLLSLFEIALMIFIFFLQLLYIKRLAKNNTYNI
jgi:hypothetical protein